MQSEPSVDPERASSFVIGRARELAVKMINSRGHERPPFLAEEFAALLGVKKVLRTDIGDIDAVLHNTADGRVIKLNANHHSTRQNFSCAHELGHIFMHEFTESTGRNPEFRAMIPISHRLKERLCDAAAAEMLMPEEVFKRYLSISGVSVNRIDWLARSFRVSMPAAAIRIAEVSEEPCIMMLWQLWQRARSTALRLTRSIGPGRQPVDKERRILKPVYVRHQSPLFTAYEQDGACVTFYKDVDIDGQRKRCHVEARGFGRGKNRYVIALAFPNR